MTDRKRPGLEFWATVVVVVALVGYPLSSGPAMWALVKAGTPKWLSTTYVAVYSPLYFVLARGPAPLFEAAIKYRFWWSSMALGLDPDSPSPVGKNKSSHPRY